MFAIMNKRQLQQSRYSSIFQKKVFTPERNTTSKQLNIHQTSKDELMTKDDAETEMASVTVNALGFPSFFD